MTTNHCNDLAYLNQFFEAYHPTKHPYVYLISRVSTLKQEHSGKLARQRTYLHNNSKGSIIRGSVCYTGPAYESSWFKFLAEASTIASQVDSVLLTDCVDRFIRPPGWSPQHPEHYPSIEELVNLKSFTGNITMATILPPDTPFRLTKSIQKKRKTAKPVKLPSPQEQRRDKWYDFVLSEHRKGTPLRQIWEYINKVDGPNTICYEALRKWTKERGSRQERLGRRGRKPTKNPLLLYSFDRARSNKGRD